VGAVPDDDLAYGGVCPVRGEAFVDGYGDLAEGESYDVRMCVVEIDGDEAESVIHLDGFDGADPHPHAGGGSE